MREESQAPRNSRELAVRNQFFTPRYVVQFLADNTLGRIWFEMRGDEDRARRALRVPRPQARRGVRAAREEGPARPARPRPGLRLRATSCSTPSTSSLAIYEEAYADPESPKSEATGRTLARGLPEPRRASEGASRRSILEHNLHGVDIDPRCAQIAQLALWLRAQKAYRDFGIGRAERAADPALEHRRGRAARRRRADRQGVRREARRCRARARVHGARRGAEPRRRPGLLLRVEQLVARQAKRGQTATSSRRPRSVSAPRSIGSCARTRAAARSADSLQPTRPTGWSSPSLLRDDTTLS